MRLTNKQQKYFIWLFVCTANILFSATFLKFTKHWYVFMGVLALASGLNAASALLILGHKMFKSSAPPIMRLTPRNYLYVLPCYNESALELEQTIRALTCQQTVAGDKRLLFIVCDGNVKGPGQTQNTSSLLKRILRIHELCDVHEYTTWDQSTNVGTFYTGVWQYEHFELPFLYFIKQRTNSY